MTPGQAPVRMWDEPLFESLEQIALAENGYAGMVMRKAHIEPIEDEL